METNLFENIREACSYIRTVSTFEPRFGIILGTGLSALADEISIVAEMDYSSIPHFPVSTVQGHRSKLILGYLEGQAVVAMAGRFHFYEGYSMQQVTFPVRVLKMLGIERLFISNAAGSVNPNIEAGDLVFVKDHINLQPEHPLRGPNDERLGPRFPDLLKTYDRPLNQRALDIARKHGIAAHEGVYVALQGPNLETPAEYIFLHRIGGDVVGMSTVAEVLVAKHMDLPVFVVSVVSNKCYPIETIRETTLEDVITLAGETEPKLRLVIKELIREW